MIKPSEVHSSERWPPNWPAMVRSASALPKPRCIGFSLIGGPPCSCHCSLNVFVSTEQSMSTRPSGDEREPCLTAFVANSCRTRASRYRVGAYRHVTPSDDQALTLLGLEVGGEDGFDESVQRRLTIKLCVLDEPDARQPLGAGKSAQPRSEGFCHFGRRPGRSRTEPDEAIRHCKQVLDAMAHLSKEKLLFGLTAFAVGDVACDFRCADNAAVGIPDR